MAIAAIREQPSVRPISGEAGENVVPYSPGGPGDFFSAPFRRARSAFRLAFRRGEQPGASGNIGAAEVARAAPDGYTFLLGATNNFVSNQFLYKTMGFDPLEAFAPGSSDLEFADRLHQQCRAAVQDAP